MKKFAALSALLMAAFGVNASQIFVAKPSELGLNVFAITSAEGYHNQPLVTAQGVYFTGEVQQAESTQMDLFFYDFASGRSENLTQSPVSEYSPTLYPYDSGLSAIVVEPDGKQRLWFYPFDKTQSAKRLYEHLEPVGYHAWGANKDMILFMLGEPHYLLHGPVTGYQPQKRAEHIGRSLAYNAASQRFSFTYQDEQQQQWFATLDDATRTVNKHFVLANTVQDYTWLNANEVAYAIAGRIYRRNLNAVQKVSQWYDFSAYCQQISRLSVSGETLAFVCEQGI
ncbi:hypothetical protein ACFOEE_13820 [Pseudoalteromonas fenneropenaei]|uniref:Uncharacterized protein n=1 Tax=Pseudoalteromonas fenneropenaei TaxID=1737459 RepID=A0ABV7CM43_9GAMM